MKVALVACIAFAVLASGAAAETSLQAAKKCPPGKARVTIAGKSSCKPRASVLPPRRAGNGLAPALGVGLEPTWGETRNGPKTLTQLVGADTKRAVEQAIPRVLARLATIGSGRFAAALRATAAKCKYSRSLPTASESFKEDLGNGAKLEAQMRSGPDGATMSMGVTVPKAGGAVRITVDLGLCSGERLEVASCPTAQGVVDGTDNSEGTIKIEQLDDDGDVEESQTTKIKVETKLRGQVDDDAKLDSIKVDRIETYNTSVDYGVWLGAKQQLTVKRQATIAMPSGRYEGSSSLDVQQSFSGVLSFLVNESAARATAIAEAQKASDQAWAGFVDEVIKKYRERERENWQKADVCAVGDFTPRSNTLRVGPGRQGQFSGTVRAKSGGSAEGIWKLTARKRLAVDPAGGRGSKLTFGYRVQGEGGVSATFRVTSKAGVAAPTWEQGGSTFPQRITGTFSGNSGDDTLRISWSGTITFVRDNFYSGAGQTGYGIEKVAYTSTYRLNDAVSGCRGQSTGSASFGRLKEASNYLLLDRRNVGGKHGYVVSVNLHGPPTTISISCPSGTLTQQWPPTAMVMTYNARFVVDSRTWRFSGTSTFPAPAATTMTWDLRGSK